jgi:hypothetical protein
LAPIARPPAPDLADGLRWHSGTEHRGDDRTKKHLIAFVQIAFVSILSRRLKRLVTEDVSA